MTPKAMGSRGLLLALDGGLFLFGWLLVATAIVASVGLGNCHPLIALLGCYLLLAWFLATAAAVASTAAVTFLASYTTVICCNLIFPIALYRRGHVVRSP